MKIYRYPGLSLIFSALVFLSGCDLFSPSIRLKLSMPPIPAHWQRAFDNLKFQLIFMGPDRKKQESIIPGGSDLIEVCIIKRHNIPFLAYPLIGEDEIRLPPAGALYPLNMGEGNTLSLSWEQGVAALIIFRLLTGGTDLSTFNTQRLSGEIVERGNPDPWKLDIDYIIEKIALGSFRATSIKAAPARNVDLPVDSGSWFMESPFACLLEIEEGESLILEGVPFGSHLLFSLSKGEYYSLFLDDKETYILTHP
ncbi:MAG: hypothetical protein GH155_07740 [Spirochaeta sp.]|nr:hypothetical protein [Spirochaeta sp.]